MAGRISRSRHKKVAAVCRNYLASPANTSQRSLDSARFNVFDKQDMKLAEALCPLALGQYLSRLAEAWPRKSVARRLAESICLVAALLCCCYASGILDTWRLCPEDEKRPQLVSSHKLAKILN